MVREPWDCINRCILGMSKASNGSCLWVRAKKSSAKVEVLKEGKAMQLSAQRPRLMSMAESIEA